MILNADRFVICVHEQVVKRIANVRFTPVSKVNYAKSVFRQTARGKRMENQNRVIIVGAEHRA